MVREQYLLEVIMENNKTFIVVGKGFHFEEAVKIDAASAEAAIFKAAKRMKADSIIFVKPIEELKDFVTDCYTCGTFNKNYVCQLANGTVEVGHAEIPNYGKDKLPHEEPSICWAVNRLLKKESECYPKCDRVIIGSQLPRIIVSSSCYYCGDSCTEAYF
jgi:hypothetical protein